MYQGKEVPGSSRRKGGKAVRASTRDCRSPGALLRSDGMWSRGCRKEARLSTAVLLSLQYI